MSTEALKYAVVSPQLLNSNSEGQQIFKSGLFLTTALPGGHILGKAKGKSTGWLLNWHEAEYKLGEVFQSSWEENSYHVEKCCSFELLLPLCLRDTLRMFKPKHVRQVYIAQNSELFQFKISQKPESCPRLSEQIPSPKRFHNPFGRKIQTPLTFISLLFLYVHYSVLRLIDAVII